MVTYPLCIYNKQGDIRMMSLERIKRFIDEKIFHKKNQKLLTAGKINYQEEYEEQIDLSKIFEYIQKGKYIKDFYVSFVELNSKVRKKLLKKISDIEKEDINLTHDIYPLVEGLFSQESFISVKRKNVRANKVGQTIITKNSYIDISTRERYKNNNYVDLQYKELNKIDDIEDLYEYDQDNESYYRKIKINRNHIY